MCTRVVTGRVAPFERGKSPEGRSEATFVRKKNTCGACLPESEEGEVSGSGVGSRLLLTPGIDRFLTKIEFRSHEVVFIKN